VDWAGDVLVMEAIKWHTKTWDVLCGPKWSGSHLPFPIALQGSFRGTPPHASPLNKWAQYSVCYTTRAPGGGVRRSVEEREAHPTVLPHCSFSDLPILWHPTP